MLNARHLFFARLICHLSTAFVLIIFLLQPIFAQKARRSNGNTNNRGSKILITPGVSIGEVKIGDTLEQIYKKYPKFSKENYYPAHGDCRVAEMVLPSSLDLYLVDDRVVQIRADWGGYGAPPATADGIHAGSLPAAVRKSFPNADQAYTLIGGEATSIGYAPPIFWADREAGIAFEFFTDVKKGRVVDQIFIFASGERKIMFSGPCDPDENLRELSPFSTKASSR